MSTPSPDFGWRRFLIRLPDQTGDPPPACPVCGSSEATRYHLDGATRGDEMAYSVVYACSASYELVQAGTLLWACHHPCEMTTFALLFRTVFNQQVGFPLTEKGRAAFDSLAVTIDLFAEAGL